MFLLKRNRKLFEKINQYLEIGSSDIQLFGKAINQYLAHGNDTAFENLKKRVSEIEEDADTLLHDIEGFLIKKSLLPESRSDFKKLLEHYDDIIDCTQDVLIYLYTRNILIPSFIKEDIKNMVTISITCAELVKRTIQDLLSRRKEVKNFVHSINEFESQCDDIQAETTKKIFSSEIDKYEKIILVELIEIISNLTDYCEDAADYIMVINIKRVV
jgi:predicted phosphate transport protein (TIGR00153 family)